jgi:hypothetical protein
VVGVASEFQLEGFGGQLLHPWDPENLFRHNQNIPPAPAG